MDEERALLGLPAQLEVDAVVLLLHELLLEWLARGLVRHDRREVFFQALNEPFCHQRLAISDCFYWKCL